jgi:hypothetical protein
MFIGLAYVYLALRHRRIFLPGLLANLALIFLITFIPLSPWLLKMIQAALRDPGVYMGGHFDYVVDLLGLLVPLDMQVVGALVPRAIMAANRAFTGNFTEVGAYIGVINLGLLAYAIVRIREQTAPYLLGFICMVVFALGPLLHVWGRTMPVALPWLFLVKLPFVANVRNPARIMVLAYMFLAVVAGFSLAHYLRGQKNSAQAQVVVGVLALLIFADYYCAPVGRTTIALPEVYKHLPAEEQTYGVLDLPGGPQSNKHHYMVYSIFHGHPVVQGALPRQVGKTLKDRLEYHDLERQKAQLRDNRVKFIVLHKQFIREYDDKRAYSEPNVKDMTPYLQTYDKVYEDGGQVLLRVY